LVFPSDHYSSFEARKISTIVARDDGLALKDAVVASRKAFQKSATVAGTTTSAVGQRRK
jgi:hypothetical protein